MSSQKVARGEPEPSIWCSHFGVHFGVHFGGPHVPSQITGLGKLSRVTLIPGQTFQRADTTKQTQQGRKKKVKTLGLEGKTVLQEEVLKAAGWRCGSQSEKASPLATVSSTTRGHFPLHSCPSSGCAELVLLNITIFL